MTQNEKDAPAIVKLATIGVYGFTEGAFFESLRAAGVQVFFDIRFFEWHASFVLKGVKFIGNALAIRVIDDLVVDAFQKFVLGIKLLGALHGPIPPA